MGYQHGALLRDDIRENVHYLFDVKGKELKVELGGMKLLDPQRVISGIAAQPKKYVPERFYEEMRGIADGAGMDVQDSSWPTSSRSCSTARDSPSADRRRRMGRSTTAGSSTTACDWRLQEHAVLIVAEPEGKIPFVNVTYAGFVGSVTGMNAEKVSIGEMGGKGPRPLGWRADGASWCGWSWRRPTTSTRRSRSSAITRGPASITS